MTEVIYIMADNRSGSTLLENMLSKSDECFSVGELAMLKGHLLQTGPGDKWNWHCSCGKPFANCPFWSPIIKETYHINPADFETNVSLDLKSNALNRISIYPKLYKDKLLQLTHTQHNRQVAKTLDQLYKLVAKQSGKRIIVDSSKNPVQALNIYSNAKDVSIKIIWLKRDLRAIAVSKRKWKSMNKKREKSLLRLMMDVFYYRRLCYAVSKLIDPKDIIPVSYESLAKNTDQEFQNILKQTGLKSYATPQYMELVEDHTVGGTPGRFSKKTIAYDDSWRTAYKKDKLAYMAGYLLNKI